MRTVSRLVIGIGTAFALIVGSTSTSFAATDSDHTGVIAVYDGHLIDLADSWQGAQACDIFSETSTICYDTHEEADAAAKAAPVTDAACGSGQVTLYQDDDFGGTSVGIVSPIGIWINLADYGFGDKTSSWKNTFDCNAYAAMSTDGTGSQLTLSANSQNGWVGSTWNDTINSVVIS